jgi:ABC-2 type transport system permease protein
VTTAVSAPRAAAPAKRSTYWSRYRQALWLLTTRDLKVRYTTSALGYLWSIIDPLLMGLIYWVVFGFIFHRGGVSESPYILFLLTAVLPWTWFNGNLSDATRAFRQEAKLIRFIIAPLAVFYRDLERVVKLGLRVLFYGAPVLYHLDFGNPLLHFLYGLDPIAGVLDLYRGCFFPQIVDWVYVVEGTVVSVILFTVGAVVFRRSVPRVLKEL